MKNFICLLLIIVLLSACEKTVPLDLDQTPIQVTVDGLITNMKDRSYVKITQSVDFYQIGETPRITNAVVSVQDDLGNVINFAHNPLGKAETNGYYFPPAGFAGEVGREYKLTVAVAGATYTAKDKLFPVTTIDSLNYKINDRQKDNPKVKDRIYEIDFWAKEPQATKDYYMFTYYRNDTLTLFSPSDIYIADDVGIGEDLNGVGSSVYYSLKDTARIELYSLSREAYVFYSDFRNIINNDGGMFTPPPANPRSNLSNGAMGFFRASAVSSKEIILK